MRDWTAYVRAHLKLPALTPDREAHIIRDLAVGDVVTFETIGGATTRFRVTGFQTVRWDEFAVPADHERPLLALATCYPFEGKGGGPWRRVAWAEANNGD